ncbi:nucleoside deaminase [Microbacterium dextranolyticum]|uniref:tRNA-specific adenosine deaminase n=1 Tax=Microbacterium dextranolyticum TaxID=36806 RepID=A0A9W6HLS1_9MICO|nr:nucleoside deaminase [Microbacterium dextranolyticum]MBM7464381.1 tRNA(Arg) A34 adenosine deaminase TadA [Microbacterium dextranolyticum]GLJ95378.1 tRNA-specific adenosine deaminase [Microbacterium dextranolyticum]
MTALATSYTASLPSWLIADLDSLPAVLPTAQEQMLLVNELADRNWRAGNGGPFAAIVVDEASGALISVGVNVVLESGVTSAHAEVMALALAQRAVGRWDLGAGGERLTLVVNWRPCVQCYGATMWSGVRSLVVAGEGDLLEELTGFDEGPMVDDWAEQFERRGIRVTSGIGYDEAVAVYRAYGASDAVVYNARGAVEAV